MPMFNVQDIRNIALLGHGSSGKTTLADKLLALTGAINRPASVDDGTSVCDFDEVEKSHHYSIESHVVHFEHAGKRFNLIDTPGYPDFIGQTIAVLQAVETAAIVINAHSGIEVNTRRVFQEAGKAGCGRIIIIDKMDVENIDFPRLVGEIQSLFGKVCIPLNVPLGVSHDFKGVASTLKPGGNTAGALIDPASINQTLVESIIEVDEEVTSHYFEGTMPTDDELSRLIVQAVAEGHLIPILCTAGKPGLGMRELLDGLALLRTAGRCDCPPRGRRGRQGGHAQGRSGGSAGGAGVQNEDRSVRAKNQLSARVQRHVQKGRQRARFRRARTSSLARYWKFRATKCIRSKPPARAISSPLRRRKICTPARRSAHW